MIPKVSRCRSCKAEIVWTFTAKGKQMPLDHPPTKGFLLSWDIAGDTGRPPDAVVRDVYTSHYATCPDAAKWRKTHVE